MLSRMPFRASKTAVAGLARVLLGTQDPARPIAVIGAGGLSEHGAPV